MPDMRTNLAKIDRVLPDQGGNEALASLRLSREGDMPVPAAAHALQAMLSSSFETANEDAKFSPAIRLAVLVGGSIGAWGILLGAISALR